MQVRPPLAAAQAAAAAAAEHHIAAAAAAQLAADHAAAARIDAVIQGWYIVLTSLITLMLTLDAAPLAQYSVRKRDEAHGCC